MQNTSRIQSITTSLMKNFFIVGVDQKQLISNNCQFIPNLAQLTNQKNEELKPDVLFSMYQKKDFAMNYV